MLLLMKFLVLFNIFPAMLLSALSVCTHYWISHDNGDHQGLWRFCNNGGCYLFEKDEEVKLRGIPDWHNAVLGLVSGSTILQILAFLSFIFVLLKRRCGVCHILVLIFTSLAWIAISTGMAVYTQKFFPLIHKKRNGFEWGYSFMFGWLSFVLNLCACVFSLVYVMLEQRKQREMWS